MTTKKTRNFIQFMGDYIASDIGNANNNYYIFAAKYTEWANNFVADAPNECYYDSDFSIREELILGKKIDASNVTYLINRNTWTPNKVWAMYDDEDQEIGNKDYYVINNNRNVYKCIYNAMGGESTIEPTTVTTSTFTLPDGYHWKYMYTLSSANNTKFGSSAYIPVDANAAIISSASNGSIDCVIVEYGGIHYEKYTTGRIQGVISNTVFKLDSEKSAANGYYLYTSLFITSGTGDSNTTEIVSHYTNSTGIFIQTADSLSLALDSYYLISPMVYVDGNGTGFKGYATVNTTAGTITGVQIVSAGQNYMTANVFLKTTDSGTGDGAIIRAIISPPGGHGKDVEKELNSKRLMIKTEFANTEGGTIPTNVSFRKFGLLRNPTYTSLSNTVPYTANTFDATIHMNLSIISANTLISIGDLFTGNTSNAEGKVAYANTTHIMATVLRGNFVNNEIIATTGGVIATINSINTSDIHTNSGDILFYDTTTEIVRSNTSTEDIGLIITLS